MSDLLRRVELVKLAHDLQVDLAEVEFLDPLSEGQLRALRAAVNHALFAPHEPRFARIASMSRHVPPPLAAKGAQLALGPRVGARVAAVTEVHHAVRLTAHLSVDYLARMAPYMDPSKVADIVAALPEETVVAVGHELVRRREHVPLGRFVSHVPIDSALRVIDGAPPGELLQVAIFTEDRTALDAVIAAVADRTIVEVLRTAHVEERIDDALTLMASLAVESRTRVVAISATLDVDVRDALVRAVARNAAWTALEPVLPRLDPAELHRLLDVPALGDPRIRHEVERITP